MFGQKKLEERLGRLEDRLRDAEHEMRGMAYALSELQKKGKRRAKCDDFAEGITAWKEGRHGRLYRHTIQKNPGLYGTDCCAWIVWIGGPGGTIPVDPCCQVWWVEDEGSQ